MRLRRRFGLGRKPAPPPLAPPEVAPKPVASSARAPASPFRGLGEAPAPAGDQAPEAELDTLRGELVRELDRMAEADPGSAAFRRIAG